MQFKLSLLLPLLVVASGVHASTTAVTHTRDEVAIGGRTLLPRITTGTGTTNTELTNTPTKTITTPTATFTSGTGCNWCECLTALAAEGVACAAAILEGGCNIIADISCIVDAWAFSQAIPSCLRCLHL
ncbi:hypothetical protein C8J57DRAFT_1521787 [Mycena rebaudengoi]|nr:hypothetical protein C8J57DRAFT_1532034 [Mycena rebaudengoi]KAJ7249289.1 hypothetical protein C8J57DRAFT_1521787 [Mycena rebaudengoi]